MLVQQFELDRRYPAVERAAEALLGWQTDAGDIHGFIGNQYATYYTGALLGLLARAEGVRSYEIRTWEIGNAENNYLDPDGRAGWAPLQTPPAA